ncbi:MAG: prolyl aminopeptidase, partial [Acidimicrobiaceae bacterium]|nr:prolyl aminopeptidase [Acidimicrobiaceae bacterium]
AVRLGFARLVTHYWSNAGFLADGALLAGADRLAGVPTFLAHGRADISAPADVPVELAGRIPGAVLHIAERDGHGGHDLSTWMSSTLDHLARRASV